MCQARDGSSLKHGIAYFAINDYHLIVASRGSLALDRGPRCNQVRPSADVTLSSLAIQYGPAMIGVILSGIGRDGVQGALDVRATGGLVIVQDAVTCLADEAPAAVITLEPLLNSGKPGSNELVRHREVLPLRAHHSGVHGRSRRREGPGIGPVRVPLPVALERHVEGVERHEREARAVELIERVGLGHRLGHRPAQLSGGEKQRVAIARSVSGQPRLLLADEPTGALDTRTGNEVMELLLELHDARALTLIIVTHDPEVAEYCTRTIYLRDGKIVSDGRSHAADA